MRTAPLLLALLLPASAALAQDPPAPTFKFDKPPEKEVDWKVQAKGGLLYTTGNGQTRSGSFGLAGARQQGDDKLSLEAAIAYGRSRVLRPDVDMATNTITGYHREADTTTNEWRARGRYDRFLTENNSLYALGQIGADKVAGKALFGGGQIGYSRQLWKSERNTTVAELGYDFSSESYVQEGVDAVIIHSARVFVGNLLSLSDSTGLATSVEALTNLNEEKALDARDPTGMRKSVAALKDTRVLGKLALTTTLLGKLSFAFGFTMKYDQNPAPRPIPASAKGAKYAPGFQPFADEVDTLTEATLIYTFL